MTTIEEFSRKAGKVKAWKTSLKKVRLSFCGTLPLSFQLAHFVKRERSLLALNIPQSHVY